MAAVFSAGEEDLALNSAQSNAATFGKVLEGRFVSTPLLVIAGAGTGKTNTLAHRVAHLVLNGVAPEEILLMTFSRRAAHEMIQRAQRIVERYFFQQGQGKRCSARPARFPWAGTFHSIAVRLLRSYSPQLGLDPQFSVIDRSDAADLMDVSRQSLDLSRSARRFPQKDTCLDIYSHRINTQGSLEATLQQVFPWCLDWQPDLKRLFGKYVELKQAQQVLDYDDLLLYWDILMQEPALARDVGSQFSHVLIDEYQDTNTLQANIVHAMKPDGAGLCVVGDDAQSIYSFRAATVENILNFPERFEPAATVVALEQNYRSVQPILDASNALMEESAKRHQKTLRSERSSRQRPLYVAVEDDRAQSEYVVQQILAARERGTLLRQQAVLMRSSSHSSLLEVELARRNIPYVKYGGLKFLEAAHIKDVLAILRWADNPKHQIAAFRTLQLLPGIGPANADRCFKVFAASGWQWQTLRDYLMPAAATEDWRTLLELLESLAVNSTWSGQLTQVRKWYGVHLPRLHESAVARLGDLEQLERMAAEFGSREQFLTELTLDPPNATGDWSGPPLLDEDYLILSTIHSAKGQEWSSVYVLNVAEGHFPSEFSTGSPEAIEEERRLLYVAMTRAQHDLHLIAPLKYYITSQSKRGDNHVYGAQSRFLTPNVLRTLEVRGWPGGSRLAERVEAKSNARAVTIDASSIAKNLWT